MTRFQSLYAVVILNYCCFSSFVLAEETKMTVEQYLQTLSTVPGVVSKRDPFEVPEPPFTPPPAVVAQSDVDLSAPVLERYPTGEYTVLAVLIGDKYPRALIKLPSSEQGKVVIVREQDKIGNKKGVIARISQDGVHVAQKTRSKLGFQESEDLLLQFGAVAEQKRPVKQLGGK